MMGSPNLNCREFGVGSIDIEGHYAPSNTPLIEQSIHA